MKLHITLLASALMLALPALAKEVPLNQAAAIANGVTPAAASPGFDALESQSLSQLRNALKGDAATLTRDQLEHARQNKTQADTAWLKASGYDFQTKANQQAGIELLSPLTAMPHRALATRRWRMPKASAISISSAMRWGRASAKRSSPPTTKASSVRRRR